MTTTGRRGWVGVSRDWLANPELSDGALRLMLWLDSHSDEYLASLSMLRTADEIGWSRNRVKRTVEELERLGLITTEQLQRRAGGTRTRFVLHLDRWSTMEQRGGPSRSSAVVHDEARAVVHGGAPTSSTLMLLEEHSQDISASTPVSLIRERFDTFWERYPRRVSKPDALRAWDRMTPDEREAAIETIGLHVQMWVAEGRGTSVIPYPATWLNRKSWDDELLYVAPRPEQTHRPAPGMDAVRRRLEAN